ILFSMLSLVIGLGTISITNACELPEGVADQIYELLGPAERAEMMNGITSFRLYTEQQYEKACVKYRCARKALDSATLAASGAASYETMAANANGCLLKTNAEMIKEYRDAASYRKIENGLKAKEKCLTAAPGPLSGLSYENG